MVPLFVDVQFTLLTSFSGPPQYSPCSSFFSQSGGLGFLDVTPLADQEYPHLTPPLPRLRRGPEDRPPLPLFGYRHPLSSLSIFYIPSPVLVFFFVLRGSGYFFCLPFSLIFLLACTMFDVSPFPLSQTFSLFSRKEGTVPVTVALPACCGRSFLFFAGLPPRFSSFFRDRHGQSGNPLLIRNIKDFPFCVQTRDS